MMNDPWVITWGGTTFSSASATAGHLIAVADLLESGVGFAVSPWDGPKQLAAWIAVLVAARRVTAENVGDATSLVAEALTEVYRASPAALLGALSVPWDAPSGDPIEDDLAEYVGA